MDQQHLKAYLDLVQQLLGCPRGEEWILLRKNEKWVNAELIEVMEQVAHYLAAEGQMNGARYLHNWAGKLHHILNEPMIPQPKPDEKAKAYADLIQALLDCPQGDEDKILLAHKNLINPHFVKVIRKVAIQFSEKEDQETATFLNQLATKVNRSWVKNHDFQPSLDKANKLAPDPWDEEAKPPSPAQASQPVPSVSTAPAAIAATQNSSPEPDFGEQLGEIGSKVGAIADTLERLEQTLTTYLKPVNPLEYLAVLEQAATAGWIVSSTEVEQLIGVKPHCHKDETAYQRGNWQFSKAGKIGTQTGWRIEKITSNH